MAVNVAHAELSNINALRKFPVSEQATCVDDSGNSLDNSVVVDMSIVTFAKMNRPRLAYLHASDQLVSVVVSDDSGVVSTLTVHKYVPGKAYEMEPARTGVVVRVVFGQFRRTHPVSYRFSTYEQSGIHDFCILDIPGGVVTGFVDETSGNVFSGDVSLVFENGVASAVDKNGSIVLSAEDSLEKVLSGGCVPTNLNTSCIAPVIQSINGVKPNAFGEIAIVLE